MIAKEAYEQLKSSRITMLKILVPATLALAVTSVRQRKVK